jgi:polyisoprenoid-binding protein YceI
VVSVSLAVSQRCPWQIAFVSASITWLDDEEFRINGDLTMHCITRGITLHADVEGSETDPWGK